MIGAPFAVAGAGAADGVTRTVHFCLGDIARAPSTQVQNLRSLIPLVQALEGRVDRVHLECSYAGQWDERTLLAEVPASMEVIAGIGDVKSPPAPVGHYAARIDELLEVMPRTACCWPRRAVAAACPTTRRSAWCGTWSRRPSGVDPLPRPCAQTAA